MCWGLNQPDPSERRPCRAFAVPAGLSSSLPGLCLLFEAEEGFDFLEEDGGVLFGTVPEVSIGEDEFGHFFVFGDKGFVVAGVALEEFVDPGVLEGLFEFGFGEEGFESFFSFVGSGGGFFERGVRGPVWKAWGLVRQRARAMRESSQASTWSWTRGWEVFDCSRD